MPKPCRSFDRHYIICRSVAEARTCLLGGLTQGLRYRVLT